MIDITKKYRTRSGLLVKSLTRTDDSLLPILGMVPFDAAEWVDYRWDENGTLGFGVEAHWLDLVEVGEDNNVADPRATDSLKAYVPDPVNPAHYQQGGIQTIDAIEAWQLGYCLGNAVKYISRAGKKEAGKEIEDLKKAIWYIERHVACKGGEK